MYRRIKLGVMISILALLAGACARERFDIVLVNGRVVDPETGLDAIRNVGIRGDTIVRVAAEPLPGTKTIDVRGLVVAPGFIDLHQHTQSFDGYRIMALDGITTALELETGVPDLRRFVDARRGRSLIHFGASASHLAARVLAWSLPLPPARLNQGPEAAIALPTAGPYSNDPPSPSQLDAMLAYLRAQLAAGALGIGMGLEYSPGATRHEVIRMFGLAAEHGVPVFVHARAAGRLEPGSSIEAINELIGATAITGAALHVVHVNSICLRDAPECLSMIAGARMRGLDVTTEAYPYTAGMTMIRSALFNPGWRERRAIDYSDIELPEDGSRLTREKFNRMRASGDPQLVLVHMNSDSVVDAIMANSLVAVASDGLAQHPRGAGTHARVLARYVREQKLITLTEAIRKMSLMPALRLQKSTSVAKRLGRIQQGAMADIVVFDPTTIHDEATLRAPTKPSVGVRYLLVAGVVVIDNGHIVEGVAPGRPLTRDTRGAQ